MALFTIADLHLSFNDNKSMNIFDGWDNYVKRLEKNWKSIVTDNDTVVIAGDISWAMKLDDAVLDFSFINKLPGKKIILKGNHDYFWDTKKKMEKFLKDNNFDTISILFNCAYKVENFFVCGTRGWFYDAECDNDKKILLREVGRLKTSLNDAKNQKAQPIVFLHYPPVYGDKECKEIMDVLLENNIKKCYYGHLHGKFCHSKAVIGDYRGVKLNLIAADYVKFTPVLVR